MAARADSVIPARSSTNVLAQALDRWIFAIMAGLFVVTALVGFIPDSQMKLAGIAAGTRPPFPPLLHVHAVLMGTWLLLLLAQTTLMANGRSAMHRQLGLASLVVAPAMVVTGFFLVPLMFHVNWAAMQSAPAGTPREAIETGKMFLSSLLASQTTVGALFGVFVAWALLVRRSDPGMHKRLMILATVLPLPAAIDRITWLPTTYPSSVLSPVLYTVLWITPLFIWDVVRHKRVHRAYVVWLALYLPVTALNIYLWWTPWWIATAERLMGVTA